MGFISPEAFLSFFPKPVNSTMVTEKFQIYSVKITGKYIYKSKNWICSFLLMLPSKTLPQVFIIMPGKRKLSISLFSEDSFSWT